MPRRRCLIAAAAAAAGLLASAPAFARADPSGIVFNAATGAGVGGATVTLFSVDNNAPASVFCADGVTRCPNPLATPAAPTQDPLLGPVPIGGFRFPRVAPGQYRLIVAPPAGFGAPSTVAGPFPANPSGQAYTIDVGSRGEQFTVPAGPAITLDFPVDPAGLLLTSAVSQPIAGIGDFLQYRLSLQNLNPAATTTTFVTDRLPEGFRFQEGSLRVGGVQQPDPALSPDGRVMSFPLGGIAVGRTLHISYVALVSSDAQAGQAVNSASALADGTTPSNVATVAVDVRDILMQNHFTIIGQVACSVAAASPVSAGRKGLANVRVLLDDGTYVASDRDGLFHFEGVKQGAHVVQLDLDSLPPGYEVIPRIQNTRFAGRSFSQFVDVRGGGLWRSDFEVCPAGGEPVSAKAVPPENRSVAAGEQAGAGIDFLADQQPGTEWLFPPADYVPTAPLIRIAIKHAPGQTAVLKYIAGEAIRPLSFDGTRLSADGKVAVSVWRDVWLVDGTNRLQALVTEKGVVVERLERVVHYSSAPARAELVTGQSVLMADGLHKPVIAVRFLDANDHPVRAGTTGGFEINPPYTAATLTEQQQRRQLAGLDSFQPAWRVERDDGLAYLELAPTGDVGTAVLNFTFQQTPQIRRRQELRVALAPLPRDWVVVGFAQGTVGYNTLKGNLQSLQDAGAEGRTYSDGKVSLYAKGRVLGKWLLTLAYDSDKPDEQRRRRSLLSTIDPQSYYTLYGDGTGQRHDASSQDKLYLKLERDQFYALFGDYETGLTQTQLSRYSRTLQGVKTEYGANGPLQVTAFAADTPLNFARDEIQGNGTSGLYRLRTAGIVLNSERIRIETRDRYHSERVLQTRALGRHLDYDIDYDAGTLFFHAPVYSRDTAFNPVFIVAEYESFNATDTELNAGGRIGTTLLDGKLTAGVSAIRDHSATGESDLGGVDLKYRFAGDTELRLEGASSGSSGATGPANRSGNAWLAEIEHHGAAFDLLSYTRRQDTGFGLQQQNASEAGTGKTGLDGRVPLSEHLSLLGQAYRQENLSSQATRDALGSQLEYRGDLGSVRLGGLYARDEAGPGSLGGRTFESRQVTASANRYLFDRKLELSGQADASVGGRNDSVDFPSRYQFGAAYAVTDDVRLIAAEEYTDGEAFDSLMTRVGLQATPWKGARLSSTLNQVDMGEYGPRSFALFGLNQTLLIGQRWGVDFGVDTSRAFKESGAPVLPINASQPYASGGTLGSGTLTEDFVALTGGLTYRDELWSWNGRAESRNGQTADRLGLTTAFLRQATAGVACSLNAQGFSVEQSNGSHGLYGTAGMGAAWRPLGSRYSILDRFELRYDQLHNGTGVAGSGLFGNTGLVTTGDAISRRLVNNLSLNRVSQQWRAEDRRGNLFDLQQRQQWSFYYGAKYAFDKFDGLNAHGYTDLTGLQWRWDLNTWVDFGLQASALHAWHAHNYRYAYGPQIGVSPVTNGWATLGWNFQGFVDRDFEGARYSAQGPYLTLRFKFDQNTRL